MEHIVKYHHLLRAVIGMALAGIMCVYSPTEAIAKKSHDIVIRNGLIFDGSGHRPFAGDLVIDGARITYVGPHRSFRGRVNIDAHGLAVAPGFIDMMGHSEESLLIDPRALSGLRQGVTTDIFTETSFGPLTPVMAASMVAAQGDLKYDVSWHTLGEYLEHLQKLGIAPNVASFVGEGTVRTNILGERDVDPSVEQLAAMRELVHEAMEEGALGVTTALIYAPESYAKTPELISMASESARCGGLYTAHMRNEGDHIEDAVRETIAIAKASGAPAEIHHLKLSGRDNWDKLPMVVSLINQARAEGVRITADMYTYAASATLLDTSLPPWVHEGGQSQMLKRLKDPATRAKVIAALREAHPADWENLFQLAGANGMRLLKVRTGGLKPLIGKTIAEIAASRGVTPEEAIIDLVLEDYGGEFVAYSTMNESNVAKQIVLPWVSFGSDAEASAPEGPFLLSSTHPRAYGNFARLFAKYVRDQHLLSIAEAVRKLTSLPADVLLLRDRGRLRVDGFADVVIFDPSTIQDHATYLAPLQFATGVTDVLVNGQLALKNGQATGLPTGRILRGRAWSGIQGGGCRANASDWTWLDQTTSKHP